MMLARAKPISGEVVEGYVKNCTSTGLDIFWIQTKEFVDYKIDLDTIEYKIGNNWFSMEVLKDMVDFANNHP